MVTDNLFSLLSGILDNKKSLSLFRDILEFLSSLENFSLPRGNEEI
jgi:hypothetical protein